MMLARIEPATPGHDKRTFECPNCNHSESEVVKFG
jgi:transcription elongation factor Elf1